jgi:hypothetical protein
MDHYNSKIQIHKNVIDDVFQQFTEKTKMLVFGLGYDSRMWYEGNYKNTFFVENKDEYIELNMKNIPQENIIKYDYKTTCASSPTLTDEQIAKFTIPKKLLQEAPFDIIIIDGPEGNMPQKPGRLIPCYWTTLLSKPESIIYIDDSSRLLETFCIKKFFKDKVRTEFTERRKCAKIIV